MKNFREIELLSSYLDGQLNASESTRLESRLTSDRELASVLFDLRAARGILRSLPARKAPRNFTLTRKMVALKPPLPRAYPLFRFSTAFATILLMISFAANLLTPQFRFAASAPQAVFGVGGGSAATEAPVPAPFLEMAPAALPTEDITASQGEPSADAMQTPKEAGTESGLPEQAEVGNEAFVPVNWQIGLLVIILLGGLLMWIMRQSALRKWR